MAGVTRYEADAFDLCIGSMLLQIQNGKEAIIRCFSRVLNNPRRNYTTFEKKL